jgi:hypothetical protein
MIIGDYRKRLPNTFRAYLISCTHVGDLACYDKGIVKAVEMIRADRNGFWGHLGDAVGSIYFGDPRFEQDMHAGKHQTVSAQTARFAELFSPIAHRMLFMLDGNHESKVMKTADPSHMVFEKFEEKYGVDMSGADRGSIEIHASLTDNCKIYCHHGSGSVNSRAERRKRRDFNDEDSVRKKLIDQAGDVHGAFMGHIHKVRIAEPDNPLHLVVNRRSLEQMYPTTKDIDSKIVPEQFRWYASAGSFLKTKLITPKNLLPGQRFDTYSSKRMYSAVELGFLKLSINQGYLTNVEKVLV